MREESSPYRASKTKQKEHKREKLFSGFEKEAKSLLGDDCMKKWEFMSALSQFGMKKSR